MNAPRLTVALPTILGRFATLVLWVVLVSSLKADAPKPLPPASNPYAPAYAALARLSPADLEALKAGKPASAAAAPLVAEISRSLAAGRDVPSVDWGVDYAHANFATAIPFCSETVALSKIALADAEAAPSPAIVDRALDTLSLGRHLGRDSFLISFMVQRAVESRTSDWLQKHMTQLSPQDAARFLSALEKLPPGGDLATALTIEKMMFVDRLAGEIRQVMAKLGEGSPVADGFASRLRMAGIMADGPLTLIGLEQDDQSFWLKPGESRHGITLISVDRARDEALLAANGQIARVRLSSRTISSVDVSRFTEVAKTLPKDSMLRSIIEGLNGAYSEEFIRTLEQATREISDLYAEAIFHPERLRDVAAYLDRAKQLSPLAKMSAEMLPGLIQREKTAEDRREKMLAALTAVAAGAAHP